MVVGSDTVKILASDFDSTLYVDDHSVVLKNVEAIQSNIKKGNLFGIVTGRNYSDIKLLLNQYHIPYHYLVCQDGAKIFDSMDYCFSTTYLSREDVVRIISCLEENHFSYFLDDGYNQTTNLDDCVKVVGIINHRESDVFKVVQQLKSLGFYSYLSKEHINIMHSSVNKKNALDKVLVHADCYAKDLYVIGDSINDYEMLSSFQGAIMKIHSKELNSLGKKSYSTLYEYIEELEKN